MTHDTFLIDGMDENDPSSLNCLDDYGVETYMKITIICCVYTSMVYIESQFHM